MRVLEVTASFHPNIGGVETFVEELSGRLSNQHQIECLVLHSERAGLRKSELSSPKVKSVTWDANIHFSSTPVNLEWYSMAARLLTAYDPHIVHAHIPLPGLPDVVAAVARKRRTPVVLTYHNDVVGWNLRQGVMALSYNMTLGRRTLETAARIVVDSSLEYARGSRWLTSHLEKTTAISPGISEEFLSFSNLPSYDQRLRDLVFVGRLEPGASYKGLPYLFKAMKLALPTSPGLSLSVIGSGEWQDRYRNLALALGLGNSVRFTGVLSRSQLIGELRSHKLFVMPSTSRAEGFGIAVVEAQSQGLPVIVTEVGGLRSAMEPDKTGVVVPLAQPEVLATTILNLLSDETRWTHYSQAAAKFSRSFDWETTCAKYVEEFNRVLGENPRTDGAADSTYK